MYRFTPQKQDTVWIPSSQTEESITSRDFGRNDARDFPGEKACLDPFREGRFENLENSSNQLQAASAKPRQSPSPGLVGGKFLHPWDHGDKQRRPTTPLLSPLHRGNACTSAAVTPFGHFSQMAKDTVW